MASSRRYEMLVGPYLPELRKYCRYLSRSVWDGDDLYQETLFKSYRHYVRMGDIQDAKPFLLRVARNVWIDDYRKRERKKSALIDAATTSFDPAYSEIRGWIEWLAARLSERHIVIWLLADYFGYTMNEIASGLRITMSAVRSVLFRARSSLRDCLSGVADEAPLSIRAAASRPSMRHKGGRNTAPAALVERWVGCIMHDNPAPLFQYAASSSL